MNRANLLPQAPQCTVNSPYTNTAMAHVSSMAPIVVTVVPMEVRFGSPLTIWRKKPPD